MPSRGRILKALAQLRSAPGGARAGLMRSVPDCLRSRRPPLKRTQGHLAQSPRGLRRRGASEKTPPPCLSHYMDCFCHNNHLPARSLGLSARKRLLSPIKFAFSVSQTVAILLSGRGARSVLPSDAATSTNATGLIRAQVSRQRERRRPALLTIELL